MLTQRDRIARAGLALPKRYWLAGVSVRLDLLNVKPWSAPIHIRDAWLADRLG